MLTPFRTITPPGIANARFFADGDPKAMMEEEVRSGEREQAVLRAAGKSTTRLPPVGYLAISGGGDNGAFGAGLLNGWTQSGKRPAFKMVTGVSTGALIAPFAFLGADYDPALREASGNTLSWLPLTNRRPTSSRSTATLRRTCAAKEDRSSAKFDSDTLRALREMPEVALSRR